MPEIIFAVRKGLTMETTLDAGLLSEFHSASPAHITSPEPFQKVEPENFAVYGGDHLGTFFCETGSLSKR